MIFCFSVLLLIEVCVRVCVCELRSRVVMSREYGRAGTTRRAISYRHISITFSTVATVAFIIIQVKGAFTAAAPISIDTLNYFASLDIPVYEVGAEERLLPVMLCCNMMHCRTA
jgi:hypothetical protein